MHIIIVSKSEMKNITPIYSFQITDGNETNIHIETNLKQDFFYSWASALYLSRQPCEETKKYGGKNNKKEKGEKKSQLYNAGNKSKMCIQFYEIIHVSFTINYC